MLAVGVCAWVCPLLAETAEDAYARLTTYRSVWETNVWAYVQTVPVTTNELASEANGRWFVDFIQYPDISVSNRFDEILRAKDQAIWRYADIAGVYDNSNAWYAVADYIGHLKAAADPRWIDESYDVVTAVDEDGVETVTNSNPLLNFDHYRQEHFSDFCQSHTNLVNETDALNAFFKEWSNMTEMNIQRERRLKSSLCEPKRTIRECFWWFGMSSLSAAERAVVRSNIVERAQLSQEEADSIFTDKFQFVPIR